MLVNAFADEADVFLVVSDVKVHYFAGYSNPVKNFVPGISAFRTVEQNHSLALLDESTHGAHPWHPDPAPRNNPLADDQVEGMELIARGRPIYALVMISAGARLIWARFGPVQDVSAESFRRYRRAEYPDGHSGGAADRRRRAGCPTTKICTPPNGPWN